MGSNVSVTELDVALKQHRMTTSLGEIAVAEAGDGPVLVMLHGGGPGASGVSNYHQNLPALSQRFRVVLPDQPGFGGSYRPSEAELDERSITEITVDALFQALDALGIDRFHLLGNSLGGAAALAMAQMRPELTDDIRALLVDNTPSGWLATPEATRAYGLSRQTLLQRVKRGEIRAVYLRTGRKKGLRIAPPAQQAGLF
jgi:4,5:9,10-diseco-3-hydroxy-5,9,17-trioxoandrosta-1(10),2-diene-4-oate hydrolase